MTNQEINIAIATEMPPCPVCGWKTSCGHRCSHSPDYVNDLNAMHLVEEEHLTDEDAPKYAKFIASWHATAHQRAEAFLRIKGLWKE